MKGKTKTGERAIEELSEKIVAEALEELCTTESTALEVRPVKPRLETSAGEVIREMRDQAA